jgi:chromosome segregation ATPase
MNTSVDSKRAYSRFGSVESETNRLQRDVDTVTRKLEQERRRNTTLDDKVRSAYDQVDSRRTQLRKTLPTQKDEYKAEARIKVLQNQLQKDTVRLNKEQSDNKNLRENIDTYRREKLSYLKMFEELK